jgi:branched-chain amino acid transport system permease protein
MAERAWDQAARSARPATPPLLRVLGGNWQLWGGMAAITASVLIPDWMGNTYWTHIARLINLYIVASVFQNILMRDAGQTSFGQGVVFGVAAYVTAIAYSLHGIPFGWAALAGICAAGAAGALFALPALRVQHFHLGVVTLSAALVFTELTRALSSWTNGFDGITIATPALEARQLLGFSWLSLLVVLAGCSALVFHALLRLLPFGRRMHVVAASPEAARSLGISPGVIRFAAFLVAALGTGAAGALFPPVLGFVSPSAFDLDLSVLFFFAVVVGGRGQLLGPIVGIGVLYLLPNVLLNQFVNYRLLTYGLLALLVMLLLPDGIVGSIEKRLGRLKRGAVLLDNADLVEACAVANPQWTASDNTLPSSVPQVAVQGAGRSFANVVALRDVDLTVFKGEIHGLVGANGSGKTTLLNAISGLTSLDRGEITIQGRDTTRLSAHRIARLGVGRTFQTPRMFTSLTLLDNIQIGVDARQLPLSADALAGMMTSWQSGDVELLAHGLRRKVEMLRVVMTGADLLLFDEPAAGLSPAERIQLGEWLLSLRTEFGKTIILVEHDLELVWNIADRITVMDSGVVVAQGSPQDVIQNPAAQSLFVSLPGALEEAPQGSPSA